MKILRLIPVLLIFTVFFNSCSKKNAEIFRVPVDNSIISNEKFLENSNISIDNIFIKDYIEYRRKFYTLMEIFYPVDMELHRSVKNDILKYDDLVLKKSFDDSELKEIKDKYIIYKNNLDKPLKLISDYLNHYPPYSGNYKKRELILTYFDKIVHLDEEITSNKNLNIFLNNRMKNIAEEIRIIRPKREIMVWKIYNHGFIIRDKQITIAFDIVPGVQDLQINKEYIKTISEKIDVLFISHIHSDHNDYSIAENVIHNGGAVVVPEYLWMDKNENFKIALRDEETKDSVYVKSKDCFVSYYTLPGHQGKLINNVYAVKMPSAGFIIHTGDQANREDFKWIDTLYKNIKINILIANCWTTDLPGLVNGIRPDIVITGHENEMGHSIDHRESFEKSYKILENITGKKMILNWAEKYVYFLSDKIM